MGIALGRKFDTLIWSVDHESAGRYNDGDIVIADFKGDGSQGLWKWSSNGNKNTANLLSIVDPTVAFTAAAQGTGTGTGVWIKSVIDPEDDKVNQAFTIAHDFAATPLTSTEVAVHALADTWTNNSGRKQVVMIFYLCACSANQVADQKWRARTQLSIAGGVGAGFASRNFMEFSTIGHSVNPTGYTKNDSVEGFSHRLVDPGETITLSAILRLREIEYPYFADPLNNFTVEQHRLQVVPMS